MLASWVGCQQKTRWIQVVLNNLVSLTAPSERFTQIRFAPTTIRIPLLVSQEPQVPRTSISPMNPMFGYCSDLSRFVCQVLDLLHSHGGNCSSSGVKRCGFWWMVPWGVTSSNCHEWQEEKVPAEWVYMTDPTSHTYHSCFSRPLDQLVIDAPQLAFPVQPYRWKNLTKRGGCDQLLCSERDLLGVDLRFTGCNGLRCSGLDIEPVVSWGVWCLHSKNNTSKWIVVSPKFLEHLGGVVPVILPPGWWKIAEGSFDSGKFPDQSNVQFQ